MFYVIISWGEGKQTRIMMVFSDLQQKILYIAEVSISFLYHQQKITQTFPSHEENSVHCIINFLKLTISSLVHYVKKITCNIRREA